MSKFDKKLYEYCKIQLHGKKDILKKMFYEFGSLCKDLTFEGFFNIVDNGVCFGIDTLTEAMAKIYDSSGQSIADPGTKNNLAAVEESSGSLHGIVSDRLL